ncbi:MAG: 50S ribosomal protein L11 methyltransferase [Planctomycetaceae bacterium]
MRGCPCGAGVCVWTVLLLLLFAAGCGDSGNGSAEAGSSSESVAGVVPDGTVQPAYPIVRYVSAEQLPQDLVIFDSVFWEPDDTLSLRQRIAADSRLRGAAVLEVGTGSGLISLCCLQAGAARVVATDLNPAAVENARENGRLLGFGERLEVRRVPRRDPGAWTVLRPDETFDLIISNPPWEDQRPETVEQFALYDPGFALLESLVSGARQRLRPGGRMWLAYGCVTAIRQIQKAAKREGLECRLLDERRLEDLPDLFLPGLLIELSVPAVP